MAELRNIRTGESRSVGGVTAALGAFFFGPFYFMFKGAWGFGLLSLVTANWFVVGGMFIVPFLAAGIVRSHYGQRGFVDSTILDATRAQTEQSAKVAAFVTASNGTPAE